MAKLWKKLPPLMADNFGFIEVMNKTDGMGIIDDCSEYRTSAERRRHRRAGDSEMRVVHTEIRSEDVVSGTRQKVLDAFACYRSEFDPGFVLLSAGPCSAMIGTDLEEIAETIEQESGTKAAVVKLSGHKTYDVGISETLLAVVKLANRPGEVCRKGINLLGATALDWQTEQADRFRGWMEEQGISVLADFGGRERMEQFARAAEASMNLVVTVSGLAAARYLKREYGIPYLAAAPFGKLWTERILAVLRNTEQQEEAVQEEAEQAAAALTEKLLQTGRVQTEKAQTSDRQPEVLIIGEQLMANAIRETLICEFGMQNIQVCAFYTLDKELAWQKDRRIRSEQEVEMLLKEGGFQTIIADPLLRCFAPKQCRWIDLPHKAFQLYGEHPAVPLLFGENLNEWLGQRLK